MCRVAACILPALLAAVVVPHAAAQVTVQPTEDGMSVAGIFHARVEAMGTRIMSERDAAGQV